MSAPACASPLVTSTDAVTGGPADAARPAPPGGAGRSASRRRPGRLVVLLTITQTLGYGCLAQGFSVLLLPMAHDLHASRTAVTTASTLSTLVGALAAVPVGRALDRYGGRRLMASGSALGVAGVVLWSQAHGLAQLYAAFVLIGLATALSTYDAAFAVVVATTAEPRRRDAAIVTITMVTGFATSLFYPLIGSLDVLLGWRTTLLGLAVVLALVVVPTHLLAVPGRAAHTRRASTREAGGVGVGDALRSSRFWLLLVAFVAQGGATSAFLLLMVGYFRDVGFSAQVASALPLAVGLLQLASRLALAPLARRYGMTRVTAASFGLQGIGLLVLPLVSTAVVPTLACVAAFGTGYGVSVVARPSLVADTFGAARFASIAGVMAVPLAVSRAGVPLAGAWLDDWRFLVLGGAAATGSAVALLLAARSTGRSAH